MQKPRLGTILIVLWGIFLTASAYVYLTWLQPVRLGETVARQLESSLNVQCSLGGISLSLFPLPALSIDDLSLRQGSLDNIELHIRRAHAEISWFSLLRLKPIVHNLSLDRPTLDISGQIMEKLLESPQSKENPDLPPPTFKLPELHPSIVGTKIDIRDGLCRFSSADGHDSLVLSGIQSSVQLPGIFPGHLDLKLSSIRYALNSGLDITAYDTMLSIPTVKRKFSGLWTSELKFSTSLQMSALDKVLGYEITAPYRYFPLAKPASLTLDGSFDVDPEQGLYSGSGTAAAAMTMTMNGHGVPISIKIPFSLTGLDLPIRIQDADLRMENDRLTLSGDLSGLPQGSPLLKGQATIHHFSLARWFGFGQAMPKGLQKALDDITGSFDSFELSPRGVLVPQLTAKVLDMEFKGSGSCADFLKPDILIDIHTAQANLDSIFPELSGHEPDMSHLPPPVLPMSTEPATPQSSSSTVCDYDIHIMADKASIVNFTPAGVGVHIIPAPESGAMLDISVDNLYKGKATSKVYLQDKIRVVADLKDVSMAAPVTVLAGYPALNATLKQGKADISFHAGDLIHVLGSMGGSVQASFSPGNIQGKESRKPFAFQTLSIQAQVEARPPKELSSKTETMNFYGKWHAALGTDTWNVEADAPKATIAFSTKNGLPAAMNKQNIQFKLTLDKKLSSSWPGDLPLTGNTKLSFPASMSQFDFTDTTVSHAAFHLAGNVSVKPNSPSALVSGKAVLSSSSIANALAALSNTSVTSSPFRTFKAGANYTLSGSDITLTDLSGNLDSISFSGNLKHSWQGRPHTQSTLHVSAVNLDPYLSSDTSTQPGVRTKLPLSMIREQDAKLQVTIDRLRAFETNLVHVSIPVSQENGHLTIPAKADFAGGGHLALNFSAALSQDGQHLDSRLDTNVDSLNLLALCKDRKQKTLLSGTGTLQGSLTSQQTYWDDWKHSLGGNLSLKILDGAIISTLEHPENGKRESQTSFQTLSMSTQIDKGIVTWKDFRISGTLTSVTGEGTINLQDQTINAKANITLAGIPELPLTITGDLMHPTTNYKLIGAVMGTVGNIGSTAVDILGSVLSTPFKLFTGNKESKSVVPVSPQ